MDEFDRALTLYEKTFDDSFPTFPTMTKAPEEVIQIIRECVNEQKDVYELGYLTLDHDTLY